MFQVTYIGCLQLSVGTVDFSIMWYHLIP